MTVAMGFIAAACGSDDDEPDSTSAPVTTAAGGATEDTTAAPTTEATTEETSGSESTEVDDTTEDTTEDTAGSEDTTGEGASGDFGLIDGVYQGAGGFTIDPADCPEDWDPMQGITDTEIKMFMSLPTSGPVRRLRAAGRRPEELLRVHQRAGWHRWPPDRPRDEGRRLRAGQDEDERRRGARLR